MSQIKRFALATTALCLALPAFQTAMAQQAEDERTDEVITVTTQKREQSILDVPVAVSALSGEFLEESGITDLDDLSDYVPGFQLQLQSVNTPSYVIRGITSDASEPDTEPNVSVFFDGIPGSRGPGSAIELFDLERVEVAKGPQGTLFSRGASNGAVNFIMKKPEDELGGYVSAEIGNFESERYAAVLNIPIIEDKVLMRLGGVFHQRRGFIENEALKIDPDTGEFTDERAAPNEYFQGKDTLHLRGAVTLRPVDGFEYTVLGYYQEDSPDPTGFKTLVPAVAAADPSLDSIDPFGEYAQNPAIFTKRELYGITGLGEYDVTEDITIASTTGYREFEANDQFDIDGTALPLLDGLEDDEGSVFFQELRAVYDSGGRFSGFAGASYYLEEASRVRNFRIDQARTLEIVLPVLTGGGALPPITGVSPVEEIVTIESETSSFSFFADGTYRFNDRWSFTAGARYTTDDKDISFRSPVSTTDTVVGFDPDTEQFITQTLNGSLLPLALSDFGELFAFGAGDFAALGRFVDSLPVNPNSPGNEVLLGTLAQGFGIDLTNPQLLALLTPDQIARLAIIETNALEGTSAGRVLTNSDTFDYFEPRFILEYRLTDQWMTYASYSWGIRSGGVDIEPRAGLTRRDFGRTINEEKVTSYEIGIKGSHSFESLFLQAEAAVFYYDYEDFQTLVINAGSLQNVNAGKASATGFEIAGNASFDNGFDVFANMAFIDGGFDEGATASLLGGTIDLSGNEFRLTPKWTASGGISYTEALAEDIKGTIGILASYKSSHFFNPENEGPTPAVPVALAQDGYATVSLNGALEIYDRFTINARVENLFDEEYLIDAGNTGRIIGIPTAIRGNPRFWSIGFTTRF